MAESQPTQRDAFLADFSNINRIVGKYYFNPFHSRAELIDDLARIGEHLQARQFPL